MIYEVAHDAAWAAIAKNIRDLDDLLRLLQEGLPSAKPWQRQLRAHLASAQQATQVLRMTIAMERVHQEILAAGQSLAGACRQLAAAVNGGRADGTTKSALRLVADLGQNVQGSLAELHR